jgi:hypothetical protein
MNIIDRLHQPGSASKLSIFRIIFGLFVLFVCMSSYSSVVDYVRVLGPSHSKIGSVFPEFINKFSIQYLLEIRLVLTISSIFFILGLGYRYNRVIFFISLLLMYNGITNAIMMHGQWPYLWFMALVMMFSPAADVLSIDSLLLKQNLKESKSYRWPMELVIFWLVILYGWAGLAKVLPLNNLLVWIEGGTIKELVYYRYLISPFYYFFKTPLFNYANGYDWIYVFISIITIVAELSAFMFLFTRKYALHFILVLASFHLGISLIGVGDFFLIFLVSSFCLWEEKLFYKLDSHFIKHS